MEEYYNRRAATYEEVYRDPERQAELALLSGAMGDALTGRAVLEVACGTGYWTAVAAETARSIIATDISHEMLELAIDKKLPPNRVRFALSDAYGLDAIEGNFDAGLANFWLSHVPRSRLREFLDGLHRRLGEGAVVFIADNAYVPGLGGALLTPPGSEDTFKLRSLGDLRYTILKNYYSAAELEQVLSTGTKGLRLTMGRYYWWLTYTVTSI